jgi:hypothetical protein
MSEVRPIELSEALKASLNNYYDLLKTQVGGLGADEFLQLKLVADVVDIDDEKYRYFSMYNLLLRSDLAIEPVPVSGTILTSADQLNRVYGRFLQRLRKYVVRRELSPEQLAALDDLDVKIAHAKQKAEEYADLEQTAWERYCRRTGRPLGDQAAYIQWSINNGYKREISGLHDKLKHYYFDKKTIMDREYRDPEDREVVDAESEYESMQMRIRYPIFPDYNYSNRSQFSLEYLATLDPGSSGLFDDRRVLSWNVSLTQMATTGAGAFTAHYDRNTTESSSITTDWSASASGQYKMIKANAEASDHQAISEEFKNVTAIDLSAKAAFKTAIIYPGWFRSQLFRHKRVKENIRDFADFFGPNGVLRYYPVSLILVRGFSSSFTNSQNWTYDYDRKFAASAGGGFSVANINFGNSGSYNKHQEEHKIDKANTSLKISDGDGTIRFVGYVVKKNTLWDSVIRFSPIDEVGNVIHETGYTFR